MNTPGWIALALVVDSALTAGVAWLLTRHRDSHDTIVVLDDFERDEASGGITLVTHVACAKCGEVNPARLARDLLGNAMADLRRAQAGGHE